MLVLTRNVNGVVVIDKTIRVHVLEIVGRKVKLGIEAPPEVCVDRREVHEQKVAKRNLGAEWPPPVTGEA